MCFSIKQTKLKNDYNSLVDAERNRCTAIGQSRKNKRLDELPTIIKKYLINCGYTGQEQVTGFNVSWKYARLKINFGKNWSSINCSQVNFVAAPARLVCMDAKLFGIVPFGALDSFNKGKGRILIKLFNYFEVSNNQGPEMDAAELVTILAEAILMPVYFLQSYITLEELDPLTIMATIQYGEAHASGIFYFNKYYEFLRFETNDRYYTKVAGMQKFKWTAYAWNYTGSNGKIFPSNFMAVWSLPQGDHTYFKGRLEGLKLF